MPKAQDIGADTAGRLTLRMPNAPRIDLLSLGEAAAAVSGYAHEIRIATMRVQRSHEDLQAAHAEHQKQLDNLMQMRSRFEYARQQLDLVESGARYRAPQDLVQQESTCVEGSLGDPYTPSDGA